MAHQMTHKEIAEAMGLSIARIQQIEREALSKLRREPAMKEMLKLARFDPVEQR